MTTTQSVNNKLIIASNRGTVQGNVAQTWRERLITLNTTI
jgi:hypothetical protein